MKKLLLQINLFAIVLIFLGCSASGLHISRTDDSDVGQFYGVKGTVYSCGLCKMTKIIPNETFELTLDVFCPDDTTGFGSYSLSFTYIGDHWRFINSIDVKVAGKIYTVGFPSPARSVIGGGDVMEFGMGGAIPASAIKQMITAETAFCIGLDVKQFEERERANLQKLYDSLTPYWRERFDNAPILQ